MPDSTLPKTEGFPHLPKPSGGQYSVGYVDVFSPPREKEDGVLFRLFYPSKTTSDNPSKWGSWFQNAHYAQGYISYSYKKLGFMLPLFGKMFVKLTGDPKIPATLGGQMINSSGGNPLIIFSHGLAGCRNTYSLLCTSLASRGYLVAALEHGDGSACARMMKQEKLGEVTWKTLIHAPAEKSYSMRNEQVKYRAGEVSYVLDIIKEMNGGQFEKAWLQDLNKEEEASFHEHFAGSVDLSKVMVGGHSFGGATTVLALAKDSRFKGAVALDTWMFPIREEEALFSSPPASKLLFVNCEKFQEPPNLASMSSYEGSPDLTGPLVPSNVLTLKDAAHSSSTDVNIVIEGSSAMSLYKLMGGSMQSEGLSNMELVTLNAELVNGWVEKCLKNETEKFLETVSANLPHLFNGIRIPEENKG